MSEVNALPRFLALALGVLGLSGHLYAEPNAGLVDPTRPKGWRAPVQQVAADQKIAATELKLQGTFSLAGERSAVISGQRVVVGDEVSGARVLEIAKNKVRLQLDGEEVELASLVPGVKAPAGSRGGQK